MSTLSFVVGIAVIASVVTAEFGECRFDTNECSCKMGEENQGVCWDQIKEDPSNCRARACNRGWTCACGGRTHLCKVGQITAEHNTGQVVSINEVTAATTAPPPIQANQFAVRQVTSLVRPCTRSARAAATNTDLILGTIRFQYSTPGTLANKCTYVAWFLNGKLMGNYKPLSSMSSDQLSSELARRQAHSLLELRPGDLVAFRFKDTSYHCYRHLTEFTIDGVAVDSTAPGFETRFAREHTPGWETKEFQPILEEEERADNLASFLPLRKTQLPKLENGTEVGAVITPGADMWKPPSNVAAGEPYDQNHKLSNFYFRIQIPSTVTQRVSAPGTSFMQL